MHASTPADDGVTAAIPAGGHARRVGGTDTSARTIGGQPIVERQLAAFLLRAADLRGSVRVEEIGPEELATYDSDGLMFVNVNTPHDYARAKDLVGRLRGSRAATGDRITDART